MCVSPTRTCLILISIVYVMLFNLGYLRVALLHNVYGTENVFIYSIKGYFRLYLPLWLHVEVLKSRRTSQKPGIHFY